MNTETNTEKPIKLTKWARRSREYRDRQNARRKAKKAALRGLKQDISCVECGKLFQPYSFVSKFCSVECKRHHRRKAKNQQQCDECGSMFVARNITSRFCCATCKTKNYKRTHPTIYDQCTCISCNKEFTQHRKGQIYCSKSCAKSFAARKARQNAPLQTCVECGNQFRKVKTAVTCSTECARSRKRKINNKSSQLLRDKLPKIHQRTCVVCGTTFETNLTKKITCSAECSYKRSCRYRKERRATSSTPKPRKLYPCKKCGTMFFRGKTGRICCSDECTRALRRRGQAKATIKRTEKIAREKPRVPVVVIPDQIKCPSCKTSIARSAAILGCCSYSCVDQLTQVFTAKSITDKIEVGERVIVTHWKRMSIDGMERLVSNGDAGIITALHDDRATILSADSTITMSIKDIATTPTIVQVVRRRIEETETWRGRFREAKEKTINAA